MNELFAGWDEHPPTNILVKALVEGFGGKTKPQGASAFVDVPPEATAEMSRSALTYIAAKAGSRLPIVKGRDKGLPAKPPSFDVEELKKRNIETIRRRVKGV